MTAIGVLTQEIQDLQKLVSAGGSVLNISPATDYLMAQVVDGNPANAQYQGLPLGNLKAGSSSVQLTNLVNKWFLGLDHPTESANEKQLPYAAVSGNLFAAGGPSYLDVLQGELGDCTVLASSVYVPFAA